MFYLNDPIKEETLKQELYSNMSFVALIIRTSDGQIVGCNNFAENFYGYTSDILCSKNINTINQLPKIEVDLEIERAKSCKRNFFLFKHELSNGDVKDVYVYSYPFVEEGNDYLLSIVVEAQTIDSKVIEYMDQLKMNEVIIDSIQDLIYTIDIIEDKLVVKSINEASKSIIDFESMDLIGQNPSMFIHSRDIGIFFELKNSSDYQLNKTVLHITKDKRSINLDTNINKVELNGVTTFICVARDIRENIMLVNNLDYTKNLFTNLFNNSHDSMFIINKNLEVKDFNNVSRALFDIQQNKLGMDLVKALDITNTSIYDKLHEAILIGYHSFKFEYDDKHGVTKYLRFIVNQIDEVEEKPNKDYFVIIVDESDMIITQKTTQLYQHIFEHNSEGVIVTNDKGIIQWANPAFCILSGFNRNEIVGQNPRVLQSGKQDEVFYQEMWNSILKTGSYSTEIWNKNKQGILYPTFLNVYKIEQSFDKNLSYIGIVKDLTAKKKLENKVTNLYNKDRLTKLFNRYYFEEKLKVMMDNHNKCAVILIEVDEFKKINDLKGHDYGDRILLDIASKLEFVFEERMISRMGSDDFGILFEFTRFGSVEECLYKFFLMLRPREGSSNKTLNYTVSSGISIIQGDSISVNQTIKNAAIAKDRASKTRGNHFSIYSEEMAKELRYKMELEEALEIATTEQEFYVMYQPIYNTRLDRYTGVEALVRWEHHSYGSISPGVFIPIAEANGFIKDIGYYVLQQCCNDFSVLKECFGEDVSIAINMSPLQFEQSEVVNNMYQMVKEHNINPSSFEIEITESSYMTNINYFMEMTDEFKRLGFSIVVDDFGTGYSSLNRLVELDVDKVKIDKSFIDHIGSLKKYEELIEVINNISKTLDMDVVAEGVEKDFQYDFIKKLGIKYVQGYYKSRPVKIEYIREVIK